VIILVYASGLSLADPEVKSGLREALAQDALERARETAVRITHKTEIGRASAFIQNIHHFRDEALQSTDPMVGKVVVFDEAQRAWNVEQASNFMRSSRCTCTIANDSSGRSRIKHRMKFTAPPPPASRLRCRPEGFR
jgi:hypothetical protein